MDYGKSIQQLYLLVLTVHQELMALGLAVQLDPAKYAQARKQAEAHFAQAREKIEQLPLEPDEETIRILRKLILEWHETIH